MKKLLFVALLLPFCAFAQKTKLDKDTIYKGNVPYALLIKTGGLEAVYSIRTLTNIEIAVAKFDGDATDASGREYCRVTFMGSGAIGHVPHSLSMGKTLAQAVVENDLIKENAVNPEGEKRFLALNPSRIKTQPTVIVNVNTGQDYTTAERNRSMIIFESGGTLTQAGVNIGTCTTTTAYSGGKSTATIKYFLPNGVQCAEATCDNIGAKTATVHTLKDNKTHSVTIGNSALKEKEIAEWLSTNFYL